MSAVSPLRITERPPTPPRTPPDTPPRPGSPPRSPPPSYGTGDVPWASVLARLSSPRPTLNKWRSGRVVAEDVPRARRRGPAREPEFKLLGKPTAWNIWADRSIDHYHETAADYLRRAREARHLEAAFLRLAAYDRWADAPRQRPFKSARRN